MLSRHETRSGAAEWIRKLCDDVAKAIKPLTQCCVIAARVLLSGDALHTPSTRPETIATRSLKPRIHHVLIWLMEHLNPNTFGRRETNCTAERRLCLPIVAARDSNLHSQPRRQSIYALSLQPYRCGLALARRATADRLSAAAVASLCRARAQGDPDPDAAAERRQKYSQVAPINRRIC